MNAFKFLVAAYVATWLIHGFYIATLVGRVRKLNAQRKELEKGSRESRNPAFR